jgi:hypothetical protein
VAWTRVLHALTWRVDAGLASSLAGSALPGRSHAVRSPEPTREVRGTSDSFLKSAVPVRLHDTFLPVCLGFILHGARYKILSVCPRHGSHLRPCVSRFAVARLHCAYAHDMVPSPLAVTHRAASDSARYPAASADCLDLLRQMLAFFPEDRITALDALAHPFFTPIRREDREVGAEACQHCVSCLLTRSWCTFDVCCCVHPWVCAPSPCRLRTRCPCRSSP